MQEVHLRTAELGDRPARTTEEPEGEWVGMRMERPSNILQLWVDAQWMFLPKCSLGGLPISIHIL